MSDRMLRASPSSTGDAAYKYGAATLIGGIAVVGIALGFQYIGGLEPCPLCLQQRWAYYAAIPAAFIGLAIYSANQRRLAALVFFAISLAFLANTGLGAYHAGAEWKFWPGPSTCGGDIKPLAASPGGLLKELGSIRVVRCDEAAWRFAGLSLAGWNVITSLLLLILSLKAAFAAAERAR